jgi:hypothetical protein
MIGPVAKIDPDALPRPPDLHSLGGKNYAELLACLSGWDAGFMPFPLNECTRFISLTKTPEFLAAGLPVVSTPVLDVVRDWGEAGWWTSPPSRPPSRTRWGAPSTGRGPSGSARWTGGSPRSPGPGPGTA